MSKHKRIQCFWWHVERRDWMSISKNRNSTARTILNGILSNSFKGTAIAYDPKEFTVLLDFIECFLNNYACVYVDELHKNCCSKKGARKIRDIPQNIEKENIQVHSDPLQSIHIPENNPTESQESKRNKAERRLKWFYLRKEFARKRKQQQNEHLKFEPGKLICISINNVTMFVNMVLRKLLPRDLFGSHSNERHFLMFVRKYLKAARPVALLEKHKLVKNMNIKPIPWVNCLPEKYNKRKQILLGTVLLWIMENVVETLLKHYFQRTKMNKRNNEIFYYNKYKYSAGVRNMLQVMQHGGVIRSLEEAEVKSFGSLPHYLGSSSLLCVPTEKSMRPILLGCQGGKYKPEVKQLLYQIQFTFKYRIGPRNDLRMHQLWLDFWKWWTDAGQPKLYFCKADITNAFGSVELERMCHILDEVRDRLLDDNMVLKTYKCTPMRSMGKWSYCYKSSFHGLPDESLQKYPEKQQTRKTDVDMYKVIEWIKKVIKLQVFNYKNKHFLMLRGLAQGRWLSSKLCDMYLSHMDAQYLHQFCSEGNFMLRAADDYIFISPNRDKVKSFHQKLEEGLRTYGCLLSNQKCVTNINSEINSINFCGNIIDITNLSVRGDYSKYENWKMIHSMKFAKCKPGKLLQMKMRNYVAMKLSALQLDGSYNPRKTVFSEIFQAALLHALKMHAAVTLCFERKCLHIPFIAKLIKTTVMRLTSHIQRILGKCNKSNVNHLEVVWLIYSAVQFVIHRFSGSYPKLHVVIRNQKAKVERIMSHLDPELVRTGSQIPSIFRTIK